MGHVTERVISWLCGRAAQEPVVIMSASARRQLEQNMSTSSTEEPAPGTNAANILLSRVITVGCQTVAHGEAVSKKRAEWGPGHVAQGPCREAVSGPGCEGLALGFALVLPQTQPCQDLSDGLDKPTGHLLGGTWSEGKSLRGKAECLGSNLGPWASSLVHGKGRGEN